jgi:predicted TPR repeat methyltransferase
VITLRPKHREARRLLALAHCTLGEVAEAVTIFEDWLAEEPDDPVARHMLAACTGRDVPARASIEFVERTFDSFAASFESKLERLSYRAPELVATMLRHLGLEPSKCLHVLDVGCGTGLAGPLVAPYARRLVGVDLSEQMLLRANEKQIYDELTRADLTEYLRETTNTFELVVAVDTLVYCGNLDDVFAAASRAMRPNGLFVFTLERAAGANSEDVDYRLEMHGRYSHGECYVRRLLALSGLEPEIVHADLRMEAGVAVAGLIVGAKKRPAYLTSNS